MEIYYFITVVSELNEFLNKKLTGMNKLKAAISLLVILSITALSSCSDSHDEQQQPTQRVAKFSLEVDQYLDVGEFGEEYLPSTRAIGDQWSSGDQVGIYMIESGSGLTEATVVDNYSNVLYKVNEGGELQPVTQDIFFPLKNKKVDFISYYPHSEISSDFELGLDLTDQSDQESLDLLYSNNAVELTSADQTVPLFYNRQMVMLRFRITSKTGTISAANLSGKITGLAAKGTFNLATEELTVSDEVADIPLILLDNNDGTATATAIVFPTDSKATFTLELAHKAGEGEKESLERYKVTAPEAYKKGSRYSIVIESDFVDTEVGPSWLETPVLTKEDGQVYLVTKMANDDQQRNFTMMYDTDYKVARWVAYPLHSSHMGSGRFGTWRADPKLNLAKQAELTSSYPDEAFDRGHQIASADRNAHSQVNAQTFYFTNSMPQIANFNQGTWSSLEDKVRAWATDLGKDTLYVVTGTIFTTADDLVVEYTKDNVNADVAVPKRCYKALMKMVDGEYQTIAYDMPNKVYDDGTSYPDYQLTVSELEELTGVTFFPTISVEAKNKVNQEHWK